MERTYGFALLVVVLLSGAGFCVGVVSSARADSLVISPSVSSSIAYFDLANSTGLWNTVDGQIQAAVSAAGTAGKEIIFGDGSDGAFLDGPTQTGISVSGNTITIQSATKSTFNFTSFTLSAGKTLNVAGASRVAIRVSGTTTISGTVQWDGAAGTSNGSSGAGNPRLGSVAGGSGVATGASGGSGGQISPTIAGATGSSNAAANAVGGAFGANTATAGADKGGGGGCYGADGSFDAANGAGNPGSAGVCGSTRAVISAAFETNFYGGSGGGGGGACTGGTCTAVVGGGGGAAGGGALRLASLGAVSIAGSVTAKGGTGGTNDADNGIGGDTGGGGGGGSGGAVWIQTLKTLSGAGSVVVSGGTGGSSVVSAAAYKGGDGSRGIFRADTAAGTHTLATITPSGSVDSPQTVGIASGQNYTVYSKPINFSTGYFAFSQPVEGTGCGANGTLTVTYEGSNDGTTFTSGVSGSNISLLNTYLYIRFKALITTTGVNPPCLTGVTFNYLPRDLSEMVLRGGLFFCGNTGRGGGGNPLDFCLWVFVLGLIGVASRLYASRHPLE